MLVKLGSKFKFMFINCKAYWKWWTPLSNELMFTMFINFYLLSNNNFETLIRNDSPKLFTNANASHIVRNSFWIKKNRSSDNEGKFHTYLKCRIWICKKKSIFPGTSELVWIWHFLRKFGSFWALLHWQHWLKLKKTVDWSIFCRKNSFVTRCCQCKSAQKEPDFLKKCQIHANSDVQGKIEFFITNSDSTLQVCMEFAFIVTCSVFLDSEWITNNVIPFKKWQKVVHLVNKFQFTWWFWS